MNTQDIRETVRERYGKVAETSVGEPSGCCGSECCGGTTVSMEDLGYSAEQKAGLPEGADLGLGCGNPLAHAAAKPGETVLDLGSGAGIDAFIASREVGPTGRVIGVDMTASMISRARANAVKGGFPNVEFRLGEIENLPVADGTVDLVISNCVVNLSPDKSRVFRETLRALRPGGRAVLSDLVLVGPLPESVRNSVEAYVGCVAGASMKDEYVALMREAGFEKVEVLEEKKYGAAAFGPDEKAAAATLEAVRSVKVRGFKPAV
ncbi:MAG TPA: arsenite methyltransferase [Candidatus Eisenbacteria bacterium]|nr:arsenite methyltransferase [Candidatus Eisenbacteria bacterium]